MAAGAIDVQITTVVTEAGIKTACDAAISATSATATISITQLNNSSIVVVAREA